MKQQNAKTRPHVGDRSLPCTATATQRLMWMLYSTAVHRFEVCWYNLYRLHVCAYGQNFQQSLNQPGIVANPIRGQLRLIIRASRDLFGREFRVVADVGARDVEVD